MALNYKIGTFARANALTIYNEANENVNALNQQVTDLDYPTEWTIRNDLTGADIPEIEQIEELRRRVRAEKTELDELMGEADIRMPPSCLEAWRLLMIYLEDEMSTWSGRWMIESMDFLSVDGRKETDPSYVEVEFVVTLVSDNSQLIAEWYDRLEQGLSRQPWSVKSAELPAPEPLDVGAGSSAKITCYISTDRIGE